MDTRFWGPSGWRLLHLITFTYEPSHRAKVRKFFETLPYVLPCKFCRCSLSEYMDDDPVQDALESRKSLTKWLWRIHNKVNDKLRDQGLAQESNPPFDAVKEVYEERVQQGCIKTEFEGWDFLFSVAENHPFSQSSKNSLPMEGCPNDTDKLCFKEKNRWNLLKPEERYEKYEEFWLVIGDVLPFQEWIDAWNSSSMQGDKISSRATWIKELWRIRCAMEKNLELVNREKFRSLCKRIRAHRSGCGKKPRARTCRKGASVNKTRKLTAVLIRED